jgi:hypothetical protein
MTGQTVASSEPVGSRLYFRERRLQVRILDLNPAKPFYPLVMIG